MNELTTQLNHQFGDRLKQHELMSKHTNFRIGGPARWFVTVKTVEELQQVIALAEQTQTNWFVFGGGSNLLVSDEGFEGIVIQMALRELTIEGACVKAEAGVLSAHMARATTKAGLAGFTWAISLPGTIGGAVRGNAGCFGGETKDYLVSVEVLRGNNIITLSNSDLQFGYRDSVIKHSRDTILSATFELPPGDPTLLHAELQLKLAARKSTQPLDAGSAGCLFKNYQISSDEELQRLEQKLDIPSEMSNIRRLSAGWLIDQLDLKGTQIGAAKISDQHGNFLVNTGHATADEVLQLVGLIKTRARNEFGIQLEEEVFFLST